MSRLKARVNARLKALALSFLVYSGRHPTKVRVPGDALEDAQGGKGR
ncbi:hypothetical protein [Pseudomonas guineae]